MERLWKSWKALKAFAVVLGALVALPVAAEPSLLEVSPREDFEHEWTAMRFPAQIGNFERLRILEFEERQSNLGATYLDRRSNDLLSLYIYRPMQPDPSIWFDRALQKIGVREEYFGEVDLDTISLSEFVPNGGVVESGRYAVLAANGRYRSTAIALYRAGDWMVKVRISSPEMEVRDLERLTKNVIAGLPSMEDVGDQPAYQVKVCGAPLAFSQALGFRHPDGDSALAVEAGVLALGQTISLATGEKLSDIVNERPTAPPTYCRESERQNEYSVYRPNNSQDSYIVAFQDAGNSVSVFPDTVTVAGKEQRLHRIQSGSSLKVIVYRPYVGLPSYQDLNYVRDTEGPLAHASRPLGEEGAEITVLVASHDTPEKTEEPN